MFDHNIFQENLVGVDFCEKMVPRPTRACSSRPTAPRRPTPPTTATRPSATSCGRSTLLRRVLPGGAAGQPLHPGDVLPDGGPPRAPLHPVPGRGRHHRHHPAVHRLLHPAHALRGVHEAGRADARRPVRLLLPGPARLRGGRPAPGPARLLGRLPGPGGVQLQLPGHDQVGPGHGRDPGRGRRRQAGHQRPGRDQPGHPHPARLTPSTTTGKTRRCSSPTTRSATRSTAATRGTSTPTPSRRSGTSTASTAGSCRPAGSTARTTWPSTPAAARSPGCGRPRCPAWSTPTTSRPPATAW